METGVDRLSWLSAKMALKKAWVWSKHHWKIIAIAVWTVLIWIVSRKNSRDMMNVLETTRKGYEDEIAAINKTHNEEQRRKSEALEEYHRVIESIENQHKEARDELTLEKRARIKELVDSYKDDKEGFNRALSEEFGFQHVK